MTRRVVLQAGVAAGLAGVSLQAPAFIYGAFGTGIWTIVDTRLNASIAFGREAQSRGARVINVSHDLADVWLSFASEASTPVLMGLTRESTMFCLELMGRSMGARLIVRQTLERPTEPAACAAAISALRSLNRTARAQPLALGAPLGGSVINADAPLFAWALAPRAHLRSAHLRSKSPSN